METLIYYLSINGSIMDKYVEPLEYSKLTVYVTRQLIKIWEKKK